LTRDERQLRASAGFTLATYDYRRDPDVEDILGGSPGSPDAQARRGDSPKGAPWAGSSTASNGASRSIQPHGQGA
jgi:hypothetical protein